MQERFKRFFKKKTVISVGIILLVMGWVISTRAKEDVEPTKYILESVSNGSIIQTVSGSGQVAGEREIDISPKSDGEISAILTTVGEHVTRDQALFEMGREDAVRDVRDAEVGVKDAQLSLRSAQLSMQKLYEPADELSLLQAQHTLASAERDLEALTEGADDDDVAAAKADLESKKHDIELSYDGMTPRTIRETYDNVVQTLKATATTLETSMYDADKVLGVNNYTSNLSYNRYLSLLKPSALEQAKSRFQALMDDAKEIKEEVNDFDILGTDRDAIDTNIDEMLDLITRMDDFFILVEDAIRHTPASASYSQTSIDSLLSGMQSTHSSVMGKTTTLLNARDSLLSAEYSYENALESVRKARESLDALYEDPDEDDITKAEEKIAEAKASLAKLTEEPDEMDVMSAQLSISQRQSSLESAQNTLADAQEALNDHTIRAPFDGMVASVDVYQGDDVGQSTVVAKMITEAKIAEISLNEVDIAKIELGQKAMVTFDAIEDLEIAATVVEKDLIGSASQGVVEYGVKVALLTDDERILSGMSASVSIMTASRTNVIAVTNSAVQSMGNQSYVEIVSDLTDAQIQSASQGIELTNAPEMRSIEIGLSDDQSTEITSGLSVGEYIVTRTISGEESSTASASAASSRTGSGGLLQGGQGGGEMMRMAR